MKFSLILASLFIVGVAEAAPKKRATRASDAYASSASSSGHSMAGCGLGSLAIEDSSKWSQVGAAFLNGTGMQTFGISFGTSNCTEDGVASAAREKDAFVEANYADLRRDLTVGSGPYLSSLASFYGCKGNSALDFGRGLQKSQDKVLGASEAEASLVIDEVVAGENLSCS